MPELRVANCAEATTARAEADDVLRRPSYAHEDGVRTLYKFMRYPLDGKCPVANGELRRRVDALISQGELYFPTAAQLNDPFEASPLFQIRDEGPDEMFERYSRSLRAVHARELNWSEEQVREVEGWLRERSRTGELRALADTVEAKWRPKLRTEYPMQCLAATRESVPMWSYYADGHIGVCIHFDATRVPTGAAQRVRYSNDYPTLPLPIDDLPGDVVVGLLLCTKALAWKHEREYRMINYPNSTGTGRVYDGVFSWISPQLAVLPPEHVAAVSVGASMDGRHIENILRICYDRKPRISVDQAATQRNRFTLQFTQLS
jgi:hypothetical protein